MAFNVHITKVLEKPSKDDRLVQKDSMRQQAVTLLVDDMKNKTFLKPTKATATVSSNQIERKYPIRIFTIQCDG